MFLEQSDPSGGQTHMLLSMKLGVMKDVWIKASPPPSSNLGSLVLHFLSRLRDLLGSEMKFLKGDRSQSCSAHKCRSKFPSKIKKEKRTSWDLMNKICGEERLWRACADVQQQYFPFLCFQKARMCRFIPDRRGGGKIKVRKRKTSDFELLLWSVTLQFLCRIIGFTDVWWDGGKVRRRAAESRLKDWLQLRCLQRPTKEKKWLRTGFQPRQRQSCRARTKPQHGWATG